MKDKTTQNQINKNKGKDNTLRLKNTDDLIKQIFELKNINPNVREEDILELLTMVSCLKYLEDKETNDVSGFDFVPSFNSNNTNH